MTRYGHRVHVDATSLSRHPTRHRRVDRWDTGPGNTRRDGRVDDAIWTSRPRGRDISVALSDAAPPCRSLGFPFVVAQFIAPVPAIRSGASAALRPWFLIAKPH